jgi:DNA-binding transcriptional LysR family regulator
MHNLEHLRVFVCSAELGSFSACARHLKKAQSAVSQSISNLELDLNCQLFDRSSRKSKLTPQGERLLAYAKSVLLQLDEFNTAAMSFSRTEEPGLVLAIDDALINVKLMSLLNDFADKFKATSLEILSVASPDVAALVDSQRADIGLMFCDFVFPKEVDLCFLGNLPFYAVAHPNHPLSKLSSVTVSDLQPYMQVLMKGSEGRELKQLAPLSSRIWWCNSFNMQSRLIREGVGWAYLPEHMCDEFIAQKSMSRLPLSFDHKAWNPPIDRVMQKNRVPGPALSWLAESLKEVFD